MSILEVKALAKSFGAVHAVKDVSFHVEPGEIYGLLGPNGAGKTTTISMICGLLKPDMGEIRINGSPFSANPEAARKAMGVVPQEIALYEELNAKQNLLFWGQIAGMTRREASRRAEELLEMLTLSERAESPVKTYSGGMKRRINIGCALMHEPQLVLMDEPTVGIDPQARLNILEFIRELASGGCSVLYTTHYLEEAESLCQRIGIIDHGQLLVEGSLAQLQSRLGGDHVFILEGDFSQTQVESMDIFRKDFRLIQKSDSQVMVSSTSDRHPSECLKDLLSLPVQVENATLKKPGLNDVFIQLTGRGLRE